VGEHRAQREDIAGRPDLITVANLLRRGMTDRPDDRPGAGQRRPLQSPHDAEIDNPGAVRSQQDVGRFQVAVNQALGMDGRKSLTEGRSKEADRRLGQCAMVEDGIAQIRAGHELRCHPRLFSLRVRIDDARGVGARATDGLRGPHLVPEPGAERAVLGMLNPYDLHS
jgi:hypothetical protein